MNIHWNIYNHGEDNGVSKTEKKVMQIRVDLTFKPESLPECTSPRETAAPRKAREYPVPHPKQRTPKKAWSGTTTGEHVKCDDIHHP